MPIVIYGIKYLPLGNAVVALGAPSGHELWRHPAAGGWSAAGSAGGPGRSRAKSATRHGAMGAPRAALATIWRSGTPLTAPETNPLYMTRGGPGPNYTLDRRTGERIHGFFGRPVASADMRGE